MSEMFWDQEITEMKQKYSTMKTSSGNTYQMEVTDKFIKNKLIEKYSDKPKSENKMANWLLKNEIKKSEKKLDE